MRIWVTGLFAALLLASVSACRREKEPNKIVDSLSLDTTQAVIPANAAQQMLVLKRDSMNIIIPVIARLGIAGAQFSELTRTGFGQYTFPGAERHYGNATFTLQFKNTAGAPIDPIQNQGSTTTLKSVSVTTQGSSSLFNPYSENLVLTLDIAGDFGSVIRLTGTSSFTGGGYTVTLTFPGGAVTTFQGLKSGSVTGSGTGPTGLSVALALSIRASQQLEGSINWEGQTGSLHMEDSGKGYVITGQSRFFID